MSSLLLKYDGGWKLDYCADYSQVRKREKGVLSPVCLLAGLVGYRVGDYCEVSLVVVWRSSVEVVLSSLDLVRVY